MCNVQSCAWIVPARGDSQAKVDGNIVLYLFSASGRVARLVAVITLYPCVYADNEFHDRLQLPPQMDSRSHPSNSSQGVTHHGGISAGTQREALSSYNRLLYRMHQARAQLEPSIAFIYIITPLFFTTSSVNMPFTLLTAALRLPHFIVQERWQ